VERGVGIFERESVSRVSRESKESRGVCDSQFYVIM
jgi:hypothetical protein